MQHSIVPSSRRLALGGHLHALPAASPVMGRHRASDSTAATGRSSRLMMALLVGLVAVACVSWLTLTRASNPGRPASSPSTQDSADAAATDWIRANLPPDTRLLTDGAPAPRGYSAKSVDAAGQHWNDYSYLLSATPNAPATASTLATVWKSSTEVAAFDGLQVRCILALIPPQTIQRNRETDRTDRLRAGKALRTNPRLIPSPAAKVVLDWGELDLRAATMLSALAEQSPVMLSKIDIIAAESAAGMPARAITISTSDPTGAARILSSVSAWLAPDQSNFTEDGAIRLHWPLSVTPMPSVN